MGKPPVPTELGTPWPRIAINEAGDEFESLRRIATFAADGLMFSSAAPPRTAPLVQQVEAAVGEALLHLLEMGLIDIDGDRLNAFVNTPHPPYREGR